MFPNSLNNMNRNAVPYQYPYTPNTFSYYNPYQTQQPVVRNVVEPQYYNPPQQIQPIYFPYMQQMQQGVYSPVFIPSHSNIPSPAPAQNTINIFPQRPRKNQQEPKQRQKAKPRYECDPSKPENSKDEVSKWLESRRRNYPSRVNTERKEQEKRMKEETGEIVEPALSILEQKLRKKIRVLSMIDGKTNRKKEFEKNYLLRCVTNPFKKVKTTSVSNADERIEKNEKVEKSGMNEEVVVRPEVNVNQNSGQKDVYDIFQEFQLQINRLEEEKEEKEEDGEVLGNKEDESPVERKCVTQRSLGFSGIEKGENGKTENREVSREKKPKITALKMKNGKQAIIKQPAEGGKKVESIEDIIENLKQRKDKEDSELTSIFTGHPRTSDYKYKTNTLLANLLIDSIYSEKNVILQCLKYIVKENFFDKKE